MRTIIATSLATFLVIATASPSVGQDADDVGEAHETIEELESSSQALKEEIKRLQQLVELKDIESRVRDAGEMEDDEAEASRELLRRYRRSIVDEKGKMRSNEEVRAAVMAEIHEKLLERLGPERTKQVLESLDAHQDELEDQADRMSEVGESLAESAEEWAEEFAEQFEAEAEEWGEHLEGAMEEWAEEYEAKWEKWGEQQAEHWEKWAEEFNAGWEEWAEDQEQYWEEWGQKFEQAWEEWGEQIERGELSKEDVEQLLEKNLEMLGEMPLGELYEQVMKSTEQLKDIPFAEMQGMEELLRESVEHALSGLEGLRNEAAGNDEDGASQVKSLTKLLERMQVGLETKREELDEAAEIQLAELKELSQHEKNRALHDRMLSEVHEHLKKVHQSHAADATKHDKYVQELHERLAENKHNEKEVLAELMDKISDDREHKHEQDSELDALREEIKALRKEIKQLREDRDSD